MKGDFMKKLSLLLSILFILALFIGCEGSKTSPPEDSQPPATGTPAPTESVKTPEPTEDDSPYNLAAGKYEVNEKGFPVSNYEYEMPLSTTDEVFTYWTTCYSPEAITEDNFGDMPFQRALREKTGVNIEYLIVSSDVMRENFSMIIASDDLPDLMTNAYYYYTGPIKSGIEDGFFANLFDYREYIPNYLYQITRYESDPDVYDLLFYDDTTILSFTLGTEEPMPATGYCTRADWLRDLGIAPESIVTYDDIHDMLVRFKSDIGTPNPMGLTNIVEIGSGTFASGYNTAATLNQSGFRFPELWTGCRSSR
jgi:putative aldouronate transport system substrate-binding protein